MQPLVSVIIPVYNVRPYLSECLDSVIGQTYQNLEIIIIDDGSTDGSCKICDEFKKRDSRIRVIHESNKGLSSARNAGLDIMNGSIVAFLDADDAYLPNMIEIMVEQMKESESDIVVCGYFVCNTVKHMCSSECERVFRLQPSVKSKKVALQLLIDGIVDVSAWNKIYARYLFEDIRFAEGYFYEDQIAMPVIFEHAKEIALLDQSLILHRIRPCSITATHNEKNLYDLMYARIQMEKFVVTHTPSVFSYEQKVAFQDKTFRIILSGYLYLRTINTISSQTTTLFEDEIIQRKKSLYIYSFKTKSFYWLLKLCPSMCLTILYIYKNVKKADCCFLLNKLKGIFYG